MRLARIYDGLKLSVGQQAVRDDVRREVRPIVRDRGCLRSAWRRKNMSTETSRLTRPLTAVSALHDAGAEDFLAAGIRHFCATARARFEECAEFKAKRQFLRGHIERIFFDHGKVMIVDNVAVLTRRRSAGNSRGCPRTTHTAGTTF
jgi:hypothetical protein